MPPRGISAERRNERRLKAVRSTAGWGGISRNFIVTVLQKLQYAEAVAKRIAHDREAAPWKGLYLTFQSRACTNGAFHCHGNVFDFEIQVNGCPVPLVLAKQRSFGNRGAPGRVREEMNRGCSPEHFGH